MRLDSAAAPPRLRPAMRLPEELRRALIPEGVKVYGRRNGPVSRGQIRRLAQWWPKVALKPEQPLDAIGIPADAPVFLEIGFGNGEFLAHLARQHPKAWLIGIEIYLPGIAKAISRLEEARALDRVRISQYPAQHVLATQAPDAFFDAIFILHPDPWPKKRHHKRRLIQPEFARLLARKLKPGGELRLNTDHPELAEWMLAILDETPGLENLAGKGNFSPRPEDHPPTKFERRGEQEGRKDLFLRYRRTD